MNAAGSDAPVMLVGRALDEGWFAVFNPGRTPVASDAVFTWVGLARDGRPLPDEDGAIVALGIDRIEVFWRPVDALEPGTTGVVHFRGPGVDELRRQLARERGPRRGSGIAATTAAPVGHADRPGRPPARAERVPSARDEASQRRHEHHRARGAE